MNDLKPSVIVISNGSNKSYQHPRSVTLEIYGNLTPKPLVIQTNKYVSTGADFGNVKDQFIADLPPNDKTGTIVVKVDLGVGNYMVSYIGKDGISRNVK